MINFPLLCGQHFLYTVLIDLMFLQHRLSLSHTITAICFIYQFHFLTCNGDFLNRFTYTGKRLQKTQRSINKIRNNRFKLALVSLWTRFAATKFNRKKMLWFYHDRTPAHVIHIGAKIIDSTGMTNFIATTVSRFSSLFIIVGVI